jgi:hypothetical protein
MGINHTHMGYVSKQFNVPKTPMDITYPSGSDTIFQILFCGWLTLNFLRLYLWSIILGMWQQPFPQSSYKNTWGSATSHLGPIRPTSRCNTNPQYTLCGDHSTPRCVLCPRHHVITSHMALLSRDL